MMTSQKPLIFISCGQVTSEEKDLGQSIKEMIDVTPDFEGYFADNQSSLEGVTRNIFAQLDRCVGLICIMHERGIVSGPDGKTTVRASVWIEQEIAIAAFLTEVLGRRIRTRVYVKKGIHREGVRDQVLVNPMFFESGVEVLEDVRTTIHKWSEELSGQESASFRQALGHLLEELRDNRDILSMNLSNFQPVSEENFCELKRSGTFQELEPSLKDTVKQAYLDIANYGSVLQRVQNIQGHGAHANAITISLSPAKTQASKSVGQAIKTLEEFLDKAK